MDGTCNKCVFPLSEKDQQDYETPGLTSVMYAASMGYEECVNDLIQAGADVNLVDEEEATALIYAASSGHNQCVVKLIETGADVNHIDENGSTALICAMQSDNSSNDNCVSTLIKSGADVHKVNRYTENTALIEAASKGKEEWVKLILDAKVDVNEVDNLANTALMEAAKRHHFGCVDLLIKAGADVHKINCYKKMP